MFKDNVKVQLSNNNELEVPQETTLFHIAKNIGNSFSKKAALAYVNDELKELNYKIKEDSKVEFITFEDKKAEESIRYTLSFLLGYLIQRQFEGFEVADIGVTDESFYCDFQTLDKNLNKDDLDIINKSLYKLLKSNPKIEVFDVSKEYAQNLLKDKKYMYYHVENNEELILRIAEIDGYQSLISYPLITNLSKLKNYKLKTSHQQIG